MQHIQLRPSNHMLDQSGRELPLQKTFIRATAQGGIASVLLTQLFQNPFDETLSVTYSLALPHDSAISGFAFTLQDKRIVGEVNTRAKARAAFQGALREGKSAALLEQTRSSLFSQQIANIPPHSTIAVEILLDQRLLWAEGSWEWRFPTVVAPRYSGATPSSALTPQDLPASLTFSLFIRDTVITPPSSPSHDIQLEETSNETLVTSAHEVKKDQDIVVRWPVSNEQISASLNTCRPELGGLAHLSFGLLTLVPPTINDTTFARDLILLLDISGSMEGAPLEQLKAVSTALIQSLGREDQLEIIAFSEKTRRWRNTPTYALDAEKAEAIKWVNSLHADGGTEMRDAIIRALSPLRKDSQRQVILMTDGLINFEAQVIEEVYHRLPVGSRVHTLGIGSAVNRSLTAAVARAGAGTEQIVGIKESAAYAAKRLVARTQDPIVVNLRIRGDALLEVVPSRLPDLYANAPALLSLKLKPEGGLLLVEGDTIEGTFSRAMQVAPLLPKQGEQSIAALYAREAVEDIEMSLTSGQPRRELFKQLSDIGIAFQISTRLTSWLAISPESENVPSKMTVVMPQDKALGMQNIVGGEPIRAFERKRAERVETAEDITARLRNVGVTGLLDAGKTTLTERMLYQARPLADDADQPTMMDCMEMERERGITNYRTAYTCDWSDHFITLVSLREHNRYESKLAQESIEGMILVLDERGLPRRDIEALRDVPYVTFVNKLDRAPQSTPTLDRAPLSVQLSCGDKIFGIIDLIHQKAYISDQEDPYRQPEPTSIPGELEEEARGARQKLIEEVANVHDGIAEDFLAERVPSISKLKAAIRKLCIERRATPVFLGSAFRSQGVSLLLDGVIDYLPSPAELTRQARDEEGQPFTLTPSPEKRFVGRVFAYESRYNGSLSYIKIYQGTVSIGDMVTNCSTKKQSKISRMLRLYFYDDRQEIEAASAGDIVALAQAPFATGDIITHGEMVSMEILTPPAVVSVTLSFNDKMRSKIERALSELRLSDPSVLLKESDAQQCVIAGADISHLELCLERLRREHRCDFTASDFAVEYKRDGETSLEPIMQVELHTPEKQQGAALSQLAQRQASILSVETTNGQTIIIAEAPLRQLIGYPEARREMQFVRYERLALSILDGEGRGEAG